MPTLSPASPGPRWRLPAALCALAAAVLLLHAGVLGWLRGLPGPGWQGDRQPALQMRQIVKLVPVAAARAATSVATTAATSAAATAAAEAPLSPAPPALPAKPRPGPQAEPATEVPFARTTTPSTATTPVPGRPEPESETEPAAEATPLPGGVQVPVYATQLPSSVTLLYSLRRGPMQGRAELRWQLQDGRYQLTLNHLVNGQPALGSSSLGSIDKHGIAPERHTESRRGRDQRAANFQRDSARISFSGPRAEYPLLAGVQDRLSWMLQLPAVLAANPQLAEAGREITLYVVGSRGDAGLWVFRVEGLEPVDLPDGTQPLALHLRREPERPYDTRVDVWLDPQRQHLPLRVLMRNRADGPGGEWLLQGSSTP